MKRFVYTSVMLLFNISLPVLLFAQTELPPDPSDVPIDGGLSLLLAAGVGYAVKKGYDKRKEK